MPKPAPDPAFENRTVPLARGLAVKLLLLAGIFIAITEILIFVPAIANQSTEWLEQRMRTATAVAMAVMENNAGLLSHQAGNDVLMAAGIQAIAIRDGDAARLLVVSQIPPRVDNHINLDQLNLMEGIRFGIDTMLFGGDRVLRVFRDVDTKDRQYEVVITDHALRAALFKTSGRLGLLSTALSVLSATLIFYIINCIMIRPIRKMTRSMLAFAAAPEDAGRIIHPISRRDEIGVAEQELARMQHILHQTLEERRRLADLGLAVSKINHDMRNVLASAQLISDRLVQLDDPTVQNLAPKLVRSLNRAVSYSEGVLAYGRTQEPSPQLRRIKLYELVEDVFSHFALSQDSEINLINAVPNDMEIEADPEQIFRVLTNLARNSVQAMVEENDPVMVKVLEIKGHQVSDVNMIEVIDTGPGLARQARENLFAPFIGGVKSGGSGLGLPIASELMRAHGGEIRLAESGEGRTVFAISLPSASNNAYESAV